jgi:hypothetical protein
MAPASGASATSLPTPGSAADSTRNTSASTGQPRLTCRCSGAPAGSSPTATPDQNRAGTQSSTSATPEPGFSVQAATATAYPARAPAARHISARPGSRPTR